MNQNNHLLLTSARCFVFVLRFILFIAGETWREDEFPDGQPVQTRMEEEVTTDSGFSLNKAF